MNGGRFSARVGRGVHSRHRCAARSAERRSPCSLAFAALVGGGARRSRRVVDLLDVRRRRRLASPGSRSGALRSTPRSTARCGAALDVDGVACGAARRALSDAASTDCSRRRRSSCSRCPVSSSRSRCRTSPSSTRQLRLSDRPDADLRLRHHVLPPGARRRARARCCRRPIALEEVAELARRSAQPRARFASRCRSSPRDSAPRSASSFSRRVTELTATLILIPTGVQTLATQFWAYQTNLSYGQAAPFALVIIAIAAVPPTCSADSSIACPAHRGSSQCP